MAHLKLLITGVSGLLGNNLARYLKDKYIVVGLYSAHPVEISGVTTERCDLSGGRISSIIEDFAPAIIVHCASLTNIDRCEDEKTLTSRINVEATRRIAENAGIMGVKVVYISTDAVYDGVKGAFSEEDAVNPKNYYGETKYIGESEVLRNEGSLVLRTNIFGWNIQDKKSVAEWMLHELKAGHKIDCFTDARFSSIYTFELSRIIDMAIKKGLSGVYNCGSADSCSKYEFALKLADCFGLDRALINPISIDDFDFKARRGKNLTLCVEKIGRALAYRLPSIERSIEAFYSDYMAGVPDEIKNGWYKANAAQDLIPYGRQWIDEEDIRSVAEVLRSDRITQGPSVEGFEKALAEYAGARYAVAVSSGTAALHLAALAAGIGSGDEVVTTPLTFVASANCVLYCGGTPVFADIDRGTCNISPAKIMGKISQKTKVIIPVHFAGLPCAMEEIKKIADEMGLMIIEDASHALGARWDDSAGRCNIVGSCSYSDMAVFSFHPVKHITTGEGGAVLTNDPALYEKLLLLRNHGITKDPGRFANARLAISGGNVNPWYYEMQELGYNYRITDMQCALGLSQLRKADAFMAKRRSIASAYDAAFKDTALIKAQAETSRSKSACHLYVARIDFSAIKKDRLSVITALKNAGVGTQVHYIPVHLQPYYRKWFGYKEGDFPDAEKYYEEALSLPIYPRMSEEDVEKVIRSVKGVIGEQI